MRPIQAQPRQSERDANRAPSIREEASAPAGAEAAGDAHALEEGALLQRLQTDAQNGLSGAQAAERLAQDGPNAWNLEKKSSALEILRRQVSNILILLLVVSALVAGFMGHALDAIGILLAAGLSITFGFVQEYKAEEALGALQKLSAPRARVRREGREMEIDARELVRGDLLILHEGDLIPADARLLSGSQLRTDQSTLTGESEPVQKMAGVCAPRAALAERSNCIYAGTQVVHGSGQAVVFATGLSSEFGRIARSLAEGAEDEQTPLQKSIGELGEMIGKVSIGLCILFFAIGVLRGGAWDEMLLTAVSLAVAAIPEGLPTVLAITLGLGVQRMAANKALVRKLQAVETLGCASVICTDKTGTLTINRMTLVRAQLMGEEYALSGDAYDLEGELARADGKPMSPAERERASGALAVGALCNEAGLLIGADGRVSGAQGDPTEAALLVAAHKAGLDAQALRSAHAKVEEAPFDYQRKMMTQVRLEGKRRVAYTKGAPEVVLARCTHELTARGVVALTPARRKRILASAQAYANQALRTLALAKKDMKNSAAGRRQKGARAVTDSEGAALSAAQIERLESGLIWVGLVGMIDPPREQAAEAIHLCKQAGIRVVMLTGDSPITAQVIAKQLGILEGDARNETGAGWAGALLTGAELDALDDAALAGRLGGLRVLARATPEHKFRIVSALQKRGEVVAVTGDGVNDAPSIQKADIGVAMGVGGTDVARGASDMVLVDNDFSNLVRAAEQGRSIYENIRSFVRYQFTTNVAALALMFITPLLGLGLPLLPLQILWINIIMDGPPALALGLEPGRADAMSRPPRRKDAPFLNAGLLGTIVISGLLMFLLTLGVYGYYQTSSDPVLAARAGTMAFTLFIVLQLVNAFNCRSLHQSAWHRLGANRWLLLAVMISLMLQLTILYVPGLETAFQTQALDAMDWTVIALGGALMLMWEEARKRLLPGLVEG